MIHVDNKPTISSLYIEAGLTSSTDFQLKTQFSTSPFQSCHPTSKLEPLCNPPIHDAARESYPPEKTAPSSKKNHTLTCSTSEMSHRQLHLHTRFMHPLTHSGNNTATKNTTHTQPRITSAPLSILPPPTDNPGPRRHGTQPRYGTIKTQTQSRQFPSTPSNYDIPQPSPPPSPSLSLKPPTPNPTLLPLFPLSN